ncbi:MAG: tyrosine-type recombinase/integrase, partial [Acetobacteraceae bacterium]
IRREDTAQQHQKDGLTIEHLERILLTLNPAVPRDARDAALISVAYETQLRRSTMVALNVEHVRFEPDGTSTVFIGKSKEDQEGKGRLKALSADTTRRLRHWLALAGITQGALFRSTPHAKQPDLSRRLTDRDLARAYQRRAAAIGLKADISGHSTRIGAAQDMLEAGFTGAEIMQQVGWRSERQLARYTERMQAKRAAMPRFLKRRRARASATGAEPAEEEPG